MRRPITPSTGKACSQRQCQGSRPKTAGVNKTARTLPRQRSQTEPPERDRIQPQPRPPIHKRQQECSEAKELEGEIAEPGAEEADPVLHAWGERRIGSRIDAMDRPGDM